MHLLRISVFQLIRGKLHRLYVEKSLRFAFSHLYLPPSLLNIFKIGRLPCNGFISKTIGIIAEPLDCRKKK